MLFLSNLDKYIYHSLAHLFHLPMLYICSVNIAKYSVVLFCYLPSFLHISSTLLLLLTHIIYASSLFWTVVVMSLQYNKSPVFSSYHLPRVTSSLLPPLVYISPVGVVSGSHCLTLPADLRV